MFNIDVDAVDTDGAIREAADAVAHDTRMDFLKKAGLGAGAVMSGGAVLAAMAPSAMADARPPAKFGKGDIGILNYALTLEYLERAFYEEATSQLSGLDAQLAAFLSTTTRDEKAHVAFLKKALGSKAAKLPKFDFKGTTSTAATFAATAYVLENTGVHAYLGQAGNIKNAQYLLAAASIVTIEARHSGAIGLYLSKPISPNGSFDNGYSAAKVLKAVAGTGFIK